MTLKFCVGYDAPVERAKQLIREALDVTKGVVAQPPPRVVVSDLTADGVNLKINFWIDTNEDKPLEVFDGAAIRIVQNLQQTGIGIYTYADGSDGDGVHRPDPDRINIPSSSQRNDLN